MQQQARERNNGSDIEDVQMVAPLSGQRFTTVTVQLPPGASKGRVVRIPVAPVKHVAESPGIRIITRSPVRQTIVENTFIRYNIRHTV